MDILLINPPVKEIYGEFTPPDYPPLGIAYLAATLEKEGYNVKIEDLATSRDYESILNKSLKEFNPSLVGITATTPTFSIAVELAQKIKKSSKAKIVVGGMHTTLTPKKSIKPKYIDFIIFGEGEETIKELACALKRKEKDFSKIKGLGYKKNGVGMINEPRPLIRNLDDIPFPARHLFKSLNYTYPDARYSPCYPIMTSRGCSGKCTYCCTKNIYPYLRLRSPKNVVDEIELLVNKYGAREIHIWDDNFIVAKKRVFEIRDELKKRKIKVKFSFPNGVRVDFATEDVLKALKEMGTYSLAFGVESGNQHILDNVKKGTTIKQIEDAFKLAKKLKIETWAFFLLGLPGETKKSIEKTIDFAKKINPDVAKFHILKPFPGSEIFTELADKGLINSYDYDTYGIHTRPVHRLPNLSEDELLEMQKKAYRKFYLRPGKIIKHITRLNSITRIKLNFSPVISIIKNVMHRK